MANDAGEEEEWGRRGRAVAAIVAIMSAFV